MFKSTTNHGYQMTFPNGLTISVQWGLMNYCDRKNLNKSLSDPYEDLRTNIVESTTAEIAVWDETNTWFNFEYDMVKGYCDTNEVARWIGIVSNAENMEHLKTIVGK